MANEAQECARVLRTLVALVPVEERGFIFHELTKEYCLHPHTDSRGRVILCAELKPCPLHCHARGAVCGIMVE